MLLHVLLTTLPLLAPAPPTQESSPLAAVPTDAFALLHCRDVAALRSRAERNDWYRLLGSSQGEPLMEELVLGFRRGTHTELDRLIDLAATLDGEVALYFTREVAGFVAKRPADPSALAGAMRAWLPAGDPTTRRTLELFGGRVELLAWPGEIDGWAGRSGHFAAFLDHPLALGLFSGDSAEAVVAALTEGIAGLEADRRAPLIEAYAAAGGGRGDGIEVYVDFTPFVGEAEKALKEAVEAVLPDPQHLLGLEQGTWLHARADLHPGTRIDCGAHLQLPADTLAAELADTFAPLAHTLPADLPKGIWSLYSLRWDVKELYRRARAAFEAAGGEAGLSSVDAGLTAARGMTGVDPIVDVLNQLEGTFALYFVERERPRLDAEATEPEGALDEMDVMELGFLAGLLDGDAFLSAFEKLTEVGPLESVLELEEIEGADAYLVSDQDDVDGGLAFLPRALAAAPARAVLVRALRALTRAEGASLAGGSRMQAAIDENAGACYLSCVELTPLRARLLPGLAGGAPPDPAAGEEAARDPFDSQLVSSARRTKTGFDLRLYTR